jgi:DNA mismatch repair protein MLH1
VDWSSEKNCFLTFAQECASFYSIQHDPFLLDCATAQKVPSDDSSLYKDSSWQWVSEHVILPAMRSKLTPPYSLAQDGSVIQIADLHELYKVFERC